MDRKTFAIAILSLTAFVLSLVCLMPAKPANAQFAIRDSRFQMITLPGQKAGSILYIIDPQGKVLVLQFDMQRKVMTPMAAGELDKFFGAK